MPLRPISLSAFRPVATGLSRPRCVAACADGRIFIAHDRSRLSFLRPDLTCKPFMDLQAEITAMTFDARGGLLIALSNAQGVGALCRHDLAAGPPKVLFSKIEDRGFRAIHGLHVAKSGKLYGAVSSCVTWEQAFAAAPKPSGAVFDYRPGFAPNIVVRGLLFPKGVMTDPTESEMFVIQGMGATVLRYEFHDFGGLGEARIFGSPLGQVPEVYPGHGLDPKQRRRLGLLGGCAMDADRNILICLPWANKIVAITPSSALFVVADDPTGQILKSPTNIAFGGADLSDLYVGSDEADHVLVAKSPVPGLRLPHQR